MKITNLRNNKYLPIIAVAVVLGIILGILILSTNRNQPKVSLPEEVSKYEAIVATNQTYGVDAAESITAMVEPSFSINNTPPEGTIGIYEYEKSKLLSDDSIQKIIDKLGLKILKDQETPLQGRIVTAISDDNTKSLRIEMNRNTLSYKNDVSLDRPFSNDVSELYIQSIISKAREILGNDIDNYKFISTTYHNGLKNSEGGEAKSSNRANYVSLKFSTSVNGYAVIDKTDELTPSILEILSTPEPEMEILSINIQTTGKIKNKTSDAILKTRSEVVEDISKGNYKVISTQNIDSDLNNKISAIIIDSGYIAYMNTGNYLVPIYVFEAKPSNNIPKLRPDDDDKQVIYVVADAIKK